MSVQFCTDFPSVVSRRNTYEVAPAGTASGVAMLPGTRFWPAPGTKVAFPLLIVQSNGFGVDPPRPVARAGSGKQVLPWGKRRRSIPGPPTGSVLAEYSATRDVSPRRTWPR